MKKKIIGRILQAPAILLLIVSFIASIYAKIKHIDPITNWGPAVVSGILLCLYFWGRYMEAKSYSQSPY
jgi:hypothetical protein